MTMNDLFADGEVLGAVVTAALIIGPMFIGLWLEKRAEKRRGGK